jgi:hypothetical protein
MSPPTNQHLLNLLRSDVAALIAQGDRLSSGERQVALELLLAGAWYLRAAKGAELVQLERTINQGVQLR